MYIIGLFQIPVSRFKVKAWNQEYKTWNTLQLTNIPGFRTPYRGLGANSKYSKL